METARTGAEGEPEAEQGATEVIVLAGAVMVETAGDKVLVIVDATPDFSLNTVVVTGTQVDCFPSGLEAGAGACLVTVTVIAG